MTNIVENQHKTVRKFTRRWFGPYMVIQVNDNATYHLIQLDGMTLLVSIARRIVKAYKKQRGENY